MDAQPRPPEHHDQARHGRRRTGTAGDIDRPDITGRGTTADVTRDDRGGSYPRGLASEGIKATGGAKIVSLVGDLEAQKGTALIAFGWAVAEELASGAYVAAR